MEKITVKINGIEYQTIVEDRVQRFVKDHILYYLYEKGHINLNQMAKDYQLGCFSLEDYHRFYAGIGYSVGGFEEVFCDTDTTIENQLWE